MQPRDGVHGRGALFTTRLPEFPWPLSSVRCRLSSVPGLQSLIDIERTERRVRAVSGELINAVPWLVRVPAAGKSSSPRGTCAVARDKPPLLKYRLFNPAEPPTLQRHPFSGLVASAGELLHTPQQISTAPSCYLKQPKP